MAADCTEIDVTGIDSEPKPDLWRMFNLLRGERRDASWSS